MKRVFTFVAIAAMSLAVASCGGAEEVEADTTQGEGLEEAQEMVEEIVEETEEVIEEAVEATEEVVEEAEEAIEEEKAAE